jgi:dihydroorotase
MTILVRKALIKDLNSTFHNTLCDLLISNGIITQISQNIDTQADQVIEYEGLHLSPGWVDLFVTGTDPGYEHKDTLDSIAASSSKGGFTNVFLTPNTKPVVQNKTGVQYITTHHHEFPVKLHPIGAITKNTEGKELTEMFEMQKNGAIAFSDGAKPIQSAGLMIKALQYVKAFNGQLIQIPDDQSIAPNGQINEGINSTLIGLPGKPVLAEDIIVSRDISLTQYADSKLHLTGITHIKSVEKIRDAQKEGIQVTLSVTPHHLYFSEEDMMGYDTNLKVNPPFRSEKNRQDLIQAAQKGDIDCISSHHTPQNLDLKICEFEYAGFGMVGLESTFGVLGAVGISLDRILEMICFNPRRIFNLPTKIEVGFTADFTLFNPNIEFEFSESNIKSNSKNSPFFGKKLKGFVLGSILGNKSILNK